MLKFNIIIEKIIFCGIIRIYNFINKTFVCIKLHLYFGEKINYE